MTKTKTTFLLENIDPVEIVRKYGLETGSRSNTSITSLNISAPLAQHTSNSFSFNDQSSKFVVDMYDSIDRSQIICHTCFWCRHSFTNQPIGCPIRYHPRKRVQVCKSELTKDDYIIQQDIPQSVAEPTDTDDYYDTEGVFCSPNCVLAYVYDKGNNTYYRQSESLLMSIYYKPGEKLLPAPSWKLLREYGGHMTIDQFRAESTQHVYNLKEFYAITNLPKMIPIASVYEQVFMF